TLGAAASLRKSKWTRPCECSRNLSVSVPPTVRRRRDETTDWKLARVIRSGLATLPPAGKDRQGDNEQDRHQGDPGEVSLQISFRLGAVVHSQPSHNHKPQ